MLRKRSRTVSSRQALMADNNGPATPPSDKFTRPTSPLFSSPRLFTGFSTKCFSDSETAMSPTSILDAKPFCAISNPFGSDKSSRSPVTGSDHKHPWQKSDSEAIGLGIVDALNHENLDKNFSNPTSRTVLFGSQLKISIPPLQPSAIFQTEIAINGNKTSDSQLGSFSPCSNPSPMKKNPLNSANFDPKTSDSQLGSFFPCSNPSHVEKNPLNPVNFDPGKIESPRVFTGCLSASEMELSEEYTCVISHGPNPKTIHIFGDCVIDDVGFSADKESPRVVADRRLVYPSDSFLSFCHACKKILGEGKDIYMYRGEKAFCSHECRYQEMLLDEGTEKGSILVPEDR